MHINGWAKLPDHKEKHAFYEKLLAEMKLPVGPIPLTEAKDWYVDFNYTVRCNSAALLVIIVYFVNNVSYHNVIVVESCHCY